MNIENLEIGIDLYYTDFYDLRYRMEELEHLTHFFAY